MNIIFDLDGTLINTIVDLGNACNYALSQLGYPTHDLADYPRLVGNGISKLIERALPEREKQTAEQLETNVARMRAVFVPYYDAHNCDLTVPYEGMLDVLTMLKSQGHHMAVASNKYQQATASLVAHFFLNIFDVVYGEREGIKRKPHPQIIFDILAQCPNEPTLYVGDSLVDIETARNAGLPVIACTWGFVAKETLIDAKPDFLIDKPTELLGIIQNY